MNSSENNYFWDSHIIETIDAYSLMKNGDFEKNISHWSSHRAELNHQGESNKYIKITPVHSEGAVFSNIFEVKNGNEYLLEFDARTDKNITIKMAMNKIEAPYTSLFVRPLWLTSRRHYKIPIHSELDAKDMRLNLYITSEQGNIINSDAFSSQKGNYLNELDLTGYTHGIYFLRLLSSHQNMIRKIIVM